MTPGSPLITCQQESYKDEVGNALERFRVSDHQRVERTSRCHGVVRREMCREEDGVGDSMWGSSYEAQVFATAALSGWTLVRRLDDSLDRQTNFHINNPTAASRSWRYTLES